MNRKALVAGLAVSLLTIGPALAQTGSLSVRVVDAPGSPIPGATVTLSNELGLVKTTALNTGEDGVVSFPVLRLGGGYRIEVTHDRFTTVRIPDLRIRINRLREVPVVLQERLDERITVTESYDVVDLEQTQSTVRITDEFVRDLPVAVPQTTDVRATGINRGLYLEDQLKPSQNLVVRLGLWCALYRGTLPPTPLRVPRPDVSTPSAGICGRNPQRDQRHRSRSNHGGLCHVAVGLDRLWRGRTSR